MGGLHDTAESFKMDDRSSSPCQRGSFDRDLDRGEVTADVH